MSVFHAGSGSTSGRSRRGRHRKPSPLPKVAKPALAATGALAVAAAGELVTVGTAHAASADDFYRLRVCESGNNYATNTGNGYYGAYQFALGTWRALGYSGLPSSASPATQDAAARRLQAAYGWGQWPACSRMLGLSGGGGGSLGPAPSQESTGSAGSASSGAVVEHASARVVTFHPRTAPKYDGTMFTTAMIGQVRADVRHWQQTMVDRGWDLVVDGRYGPQSAAVCTAFEREKGLHVETPGIVGPQVWKATFESPAS
jgi:peptidoglycan hydrolase-like protein with peptidoglycan-binding domain